MGGYLNPGLEGFQSGFPGNSTLDDPLNYLLDRRKVTPQVNDKDTQLSAAALLLLENGKTTHSAVTLHSLLVGVFLKKVWKKTEFIMISHILSRTLSNSYNTIAPGHIRY